MRRAGGSRACGEKAKTTRRRERTERRIGLTETRRLVGSPKNALRGVITRRRRLLPSSTIEDRLLVRDPRTGGEHTVAVTFLRVHQHHSHPRTHNTRKRRPSLFIPRPRFPQRSLDRTARCEILRERSTGDATRRVVK